MPKTLPIALIAFFLLFPLSTPADANQAITSRAAHSVEKTSRAKHHPPRNHHHTRRSHRADEYACHSHQPYYDRGRYGRGYYGESRYQTGPCWRERRRGHFDGEPAIISVRLCRGRHGRIDVVEGSERLIRFRRHHPHH